MGFSAVKITVIAPSITDITTCCVSFSLCFSLEETEKCVFIQRFCYKCPLSAQSPRSSVR